MSELPERKHAYLIIAHKDPLVLKNLVALLDDERSDIFIHVDAKSHLDGGSVKASSSRLFFVPRMNVQWGGESMVACEMNLLKAAVMKGRYQYYHLLSGQDLPIKDQDYINQFFDRNLGTEYFDVWPFKYRQSQRTENILLTDGSDCSEYAYLLDDLSLIRQKECNFKRKRDSRYPHYAGSSWFSITHGAACHLIASEPEIVKYFYKGYAADEVFLQTLLMNSDFSRRLGGSVRYIKGFNDAHPFTIRCRDIPDVRATGCLFARKFDSSIDCLSIGETVRMVRGEPLHYEGCEL